MDGWTDRGVEGQTSSQATVMIVWNLLFTWHRMLRSKRCRTSLIIFFFQKQCKVSSCNVCAGCVLMRTWIIAYYMRYPRQSVIQVHFLERRPPFIGFRRSVSAGDSLTHCQSKTHALCFFLRDSPASKIHFQISFWFIITFS